MSKPIYILNGPNLNLLGTREPDIYGYTTLTDLRDMCIAHADARGLEVFFAQSNREYEIIEWIHEAIEGADGIIINPAALTHTSLSILDALKNVNSPIIEVHISNPHTREDFRHFSYVTYAATGTIAGLGVNGYLTAIDAMANMLTSA